MVNCYWEELLIVQYQRLGDTGLIVSRLAFGVMTFGTPQGPNAALAAAIAKVDSQNLATEIIARALDGGINHFNTANVYTGGNSEAMLGKALGSRRKDVVISTKVGARTNDNVLNAGLSRRNILAAAEDSLRRLGTDYIDVYLVHRMDPYTLIEETLEALNDLVRMGKVRYIGFSNWSTWTAAKAVGIQNQRGWTRFCAAEMYYSLLGRDLDHEFVPFVTDAGIGVLVWSPLAGGFLSGKYTRQSPHGDGGRLANLTLVPYDLDKGYDVVDRMRALAARHDATPAQIALAWLLAKPFVSSILLGANKVTQLEDNLGALQVKLTEGEIAELDALTAPPAQYPAWFYDRFSDQVAKKALGVKL
jgi:aryl-alcohol dehydrogenase-like predicted oxidoreductase